MKDVDRLKDLLQYRISNELFYNENLIEIKNPEVRQLFSQFRDDEMRAIINLQQKIERLDAKPYIVSKIFPIKPRT
ncbi:PA2169 family four-helix-bundle protein [Crassaminicella profunda]|uniref:PA2169 family four-helix-bundle protein n=1 Tax=Crassaminicella profunda TaxID=1286698 RepID=UPI001CA77996|nr:PA2169 family four-helix-bundle protein [Crassaminicella profunda]QZY54573.1 PA2169 family four-helix-bundle protein [Crassaminicella profunda]